MNIDNMAYADAMTYRAQSDSLKSVADSANVLASNLYRTIRQGQKTIETKDELNAFEKSKGEMIASENKKLKFSVGFWRFYAGVATFVAGIFILKSL